MTSHSLLQHCHRQQRSHSTAVRSAQTAGLISNPKRTQSTTPRIATSTIQSSHHGALESGIRNESRNQLHCHYAVTMPFWGLATAPAPPPPVAGLAEAVQRGEPHGGVEAAAAQAGACQSARAEPSEAERRRTLLELDLWQARHLPLR